MESIYRNTIGILVAGLAGFCTLIIAHNLVSGDTMEVLLPVLDTNFWLATHVVIITFGYTATLVAGLIGIVYIIMGVTSPYLTSENGQTLTKMIYGVVCFATLLSFTGTVLGGLWADYSWGRFWGWGPKENSALLIVIWNAMVLHAALGRHDQAARHGRVGGRRQYRNFVVVVRHQYAGCRAAQLWRLVFFRTGVADPRHLSTSCDHGGRDVAAQILVQLRAKSPLPPPSSGGDTRGLRGDLRTGVRSGVAVGAGSREHWHPARRGANLRLCQLSK